MLATPHSPNSTQSYSLFDALRESIYSEVATLIANNESRPHFLVSVYVRMQCAHVYTHVHEWLATVFACVGHELEKACMVLHLYCLD